MLSFAAIFAGLGLAGISGRGAAPSVVLGVFRRSAARWLLLSVGLGLLRHAVTPYVLRWINRLAGAAIGGMGLRVLLSLR